MSLAPGEQRTLTEIESQLGKSDPRLVATFALFAAGGMRRRPLLWHLPPLRYLLLLRHLPRRTPGPGSRARMFILAAVCVTLLIACAAVAVVATSRAAPSRGGQGPGASPAGMYLLGR